MPQSQARLNPAQYTFAPSSSQITFAGVPGFVLDGLIEVLHVASGNVLYDAYDPTLGGSVSGNVLTLAFSTTGTYGAGTSYTSADPLRIIYNDLTREDQLLVYNPTATGVFATVPLRGYLLAAAQIVSTQSCTVQIQASLDGNVANAVTLNGILPDLPNNPGDVNLNNGGSYNLRYYEVAAFRFLHLRCTNYTASSAPVVNLVLKTNLPPHHLNYIIGGSLGVSLVGGNAQIGYFAVGQNYQEALRTTVAAGATFTGAWRDTLYNPLAYNTFGALVNTDQSGTLQIQFSTDAANPIPANLPVAVTAGTPLDIKVPVRARYARAVFVNGSTATGATAFTLLTSFLGS